MKITWDSKIETLKNHIKMYSQKETDLMFFKDYIYNFIAIIKDMQTLKELYENHTDNIGIEELLNQTGDKP